MNNLKKFNVFIEYIHPSKRDLTAVKKGLWDIVSVPNRWRHARLVVLKEPVDIISNGVKGDVYDAGKNDKNRLVPMCEIFQPDTLNSYLAIGNLKANLKGDDIKDFGKYRLTVFLLGYPLSSLKPRGC